MPCAERNQNRHTKLIRMAADLITAYPPSPAEAAQEPEYDLCDSRVHSERRRLTLVRLAADEGTVAARLSTRDRINIARAEDTALFNSLLDEWLAAMPSKQVMTLDVSHETLQYEKSKRMIFERLNL
jgi:hypothetical protein